MAMNKNGMLNTTFKRESATSTVKAGYDLARMIAYCKTKGIKMEDLSPSELAMFEIK